MITFTTSLVRELRGSPLTVLIAGMLLQQANQKITVMLLKDVTGYGDHTLTDAIRALESPTRQLFTRVTGGWQLSTGFQLPLEINPEIRDIRGNLLSSSSCLNKNQSDFVREGEEEGEKNRDIRGFSDCLRACLACGIREPKASRLARLPHVTPAIIAGHVKQAIEQNQANPIGTAIYRIEAGWPVLEQFKKIDQHLDGNKYVEGEYADYIEH